MVSGFSLYFERRICTYEYGEWIISKCCKCWTVILYAFVGRLLDQYNEKILISISSFLLGSSLLLTNIVRGFNGLLFVLLLIGMFYSVSQPGGSKVILKWFRKENRGLAMGIRQAGIPIGGALAGVLIRFLQYNII